MRQLLRYRPAMRIAHDGASIEMSLGQHNVQIRGERRHIIWAVDIAAFAVAAQVGNKHPKPVSQELDQRIKHRARNHDTVQQE